MDSYAEVTACYRYRRITRGIVTLVAGHQSSFSAETVTLIQEGRLLWAIGAISLHVAGSLAMTAAGLLSFQLIGTR